MVVSMGNDLDSVLVDEILKPVLVIRSVGDV